MSAPQVIMVVILTLGVAVPVLRHGQKHPPYDARLSLASAAITVALLWWGGFWG